MAKKTRDEVDALKRSWARDPCFDLWDVEGFEDYRAELKEYASAVEAARLRRARECDLLNRGGPAFPRPVSGITEDVAAHGVTGDAQDGMMLLEYLAAHAPPCPEWFAHVPHPNEPKPPPDHKDGLGPEPDPYVEGHEARSAWIGRANARFEELKPLRERYERRHRAWKQADRLTRMAQWAWAYARMMLRTWVGIPCDPPTREQLRQEEEDAADGWSL